MTGQGPNQHTKNLMILFSEQITVFEFGDKNHVIFDIGPSHSIMWFCYSRASQNWFWNVWDVKFELIWLGTYVNSFIQIQNTTPTIHFLTEHQKNEEITSWYVNIYVLIPILKVSWGPKQFCSVKENWPHHQGRKSWLFCFPSLPPPSNRFFWMRRSNNI